MARLMTSCPAEDLQARVGRDDLLNHENRIIATIYIITSLLSMFGAGSVIIFAVVKKIVRSAEVRPIFHLAVADFFLSLWWLVGAAVWLAKEGNPTSMSKGIVCFYLDTTAEIFHLASFFLTVNYGINVYIRLREKTYNINNFRFSVGNSGPSVFYRWMFVAFYLISWLLPVIIMVPLLVRFSGKMKVLDNPHCTRCLLLFDRPRPLVDSGMSTNMAWILYGSIALVMSLCFSIVALTILYFMANRVYQRSIMRSGVVTDIQRSSIDTMRNRIFLYILVFLVCWGPALVIASADLQPGGKMLGIHRWFPLFIAQGLTAPMQGFLNSLVYGWTRRTFRNARNRQPLLDTMDQSHLGISYGSTADSL